MPLGLDPGTYSVYVSTDGNDFVPTYGTSPFQITVDACPDGYFCSAAAATICPPGYYCPASATMEAIKCPAGMVNSMSG